MISRVKMTAAFAATLLITTAAAQTPAPATTEQRVESLLARMTLEEKLGQLIQYTASKEEIRDLAAKGSVGCIFSIGGAVETNALQRAAVDESRLKIPLLFANDVI